MSKAILRSLVLAAAVALLATPAFAQANFGKYVALGDSLTAAFASGGLHVDVQQRSYPALIARQAGVTDFQQPLAGAPGIPPLLAIAGFNGASPVIVPRSANPGAPLNLTLPRPYDNLAVPGFDARDVLETRTGNPIIDLVLRGLGTQLELAAVQQPTFATVWIGNNDVLGAATSGIVIDGVTLTRSEDFNQFFTIVTGTLLNVGAQMAFANIPDVTAIPFVNTLPPVVLNPATGDPVIGPNGQFIPLIGPQGLLGPNDKVLLTATTFLAQGIGIPAAIGGTGQPLPDSAVLSAAEVATIQARTAELNAVIAQRADDFGAALVDVHAFFDDVAANGFAAGGNIVYTTDFLTGGIFSYDGVHPSPMGYAVLANLFIEAINRHFGDNIPPVGLIPFIFGPDGSAGGTIQAPGLIEGTPIFTTAASESLRLSFGLPTAAELERIKRELENEHPDEPAGPTLRLAPPRPSAPPTLRLSIGG
jgi:lysophospholipase L1-like esterase